MGGRGETKYARWRNIREEVEERAAERKRETGREIEISSSRENFANFQRLKIARSRHETCNAPLVFRWDVYHPFF